MHPLSNISLCVCVCVCLQSLYTASDELKKTKADKSLVELEVQDVCLQGVCVYMYVAMYMCVSVCMYVCVMNGYICVWG